MSVGCKVTVVEWPDPSILTVVFKLCFNLGNIRQFKKIPQPQTLQRLQ